MTGMKKEVDVVGAVIVRDGLVLAAQRSADMSMPGLWEFPGGKIEPGESPQAALVREIAEELGCDIAVGDLVVRTRHEYESVIVHLTTYFATLTRGEPHALEHAELRWVPVPKLGALTWAAADVEAVARVSSALA